MRKLSSLLVVILLTACSIPFAQQPAAPTQALIPTTDLETILPEPAVAVTLAAEEAMPVGDEDIPVDTCPTCSVENTGCQDDLESCQAAATEMAATIIAFQAFGGESESGLAAEVTATPDMSGGMPPLTATPDLQAGMPPLTATIDPLAVGMPTATLEAVPAIPEEGIRYRAEAVVYKKNFAHPDKGCNWMGVAGQVLDSSGNPVKNLVVIAEGVLQGNDLLQVDITGLHDAYGPGGYEIELGSSAVATTNMIYITIYDLDGNVLSSPVSIATRADCNQNVLILNFQQAP